MGLLAIVDCLASREPPAAMARLGLLVRMVPWGREACVVSGVSRGLKARQAQRGPLVRLARTGAVVPKVNAANKDCSAPQALSDLSVTAEPPVRLVCKGCRVQRGKTASRGRRVLAEASVLSVYVAKLVRLASRGLSARKVTLVRLVRRALLVQLVSRGRVARVAR